MKLHFNKGQLAQRLYENIRRQAASLKVQTYFRMYSAQKVYRGLSSSSVIIQACCRGMTARKELQFRKQTRAAIVIQVRISNIEP